MKKIKVDSALLQEKLLRLKRCHRHREKLERTTRSTEMAKEAEAVSDLLKQLSEESTTLETYLAELKSKFEIMTKRDKTLDEKFRQEFLDLKPFFVDHLFKAFKRRPKLTSISSITFLTELSRCIVETKTSDFLPKDLNAFVKAIENYDAMPANTPTPITPHHWTHMCKVRRVKIDNELKVSAKKGF